MNIEILKDKNGYKYDFQSYNIGDIEPELFPKAYRTFTVVFLNSNKRLVAIGIINSLYDFVQSITYNSEELSKKDIKYFAFITNQRQVNRFLLAKRTLKTLKLTFQSTVILKRE
jgi:hypothetical protein